MGWGTPFVLAHFGWRATLAVGLSALVYYLWFRRELQSLAPEAAQATAIAKPSTSRLPIPWWVTTTYVAFLVWTVVNAHHPALFIGGFLFFLGFDRATAEYSTLEDFKTPLLVGFFLAALVIHGGLQGWWIAPVLSRLARVPAVCRVIDPHGVQRQRADHVSGDPGS